MIHYFLTTKDFFKSGDCGRVSHATGFVSGVTDNDSNLCVYSDDTNGYFSNNAKVTSISFRKLLIFKSLLRVFHLLRKNDDIVVVRWRPVLSFVFLPTAVFNKNRFFFEVNGLTGTGEEYSVPVRIISKFSVKVVSIFYNTIAVSESTKSTLVKYSSSQIKNCYVMENGFVDNGFSRIKPLSSENKKFNIIYFGGHQKYYDWDLVHNFLDKHSENRFEDIYIWGFKDTELEKKGVTTFGQFNHVEIVTFLKSVENPILLLHSDSSDLSKSGSPMKLFEYAATGIPVLVSDSLYTVAQKMESFHHYQAGDIHSFISSLDHIELHYDTFIERGKNSRHYILSYYCWAAVVARWLKHLENTVK